MKYGVSKPWEFSKGFFTLTMPYCLTENVQMYYFRNNIMSFPELIFCGTRKHLTTLYADPLRKNKKKSDCKCGKYG
jgi:hypothetical protein